MDSLVALAAFSLVTTVTPGPNNVLLWASGAAFGFRATLRHVLGTALGVAAIALATAVGLAAVAAAVPELAFAMKLVGSAYLLSLAYHVARSEMIERGSAARPLGLLNAAAFQAVNPKVWVFALAAMTAFRPASGNPPAHTIAMAATMALAAIPTSAAWAGAGGLLGRLLARGRTRRLVTLGLAGLLVVSVAYVWI